jgi:hypothetical protein
MMFRRTEKNPESFWQEYEEKTGEKILARSLGRYIYGWKDFDSRKWNDIWGLIIATSGGFRFHHFQQHSWFDAMINFTGGEAPKEKTFFIPKEKITSVRLNKETKWWKKLFTSSPPQLIIQYRDDMEKEHHVFLEAEYRSDEVAEKLCREIE